MGDVIPLPPRPQIVERFRHVETHADFGDLKVTIARTDESDTPVALILDGLGYGIGFEVLGRFEADEVGEAFCRLMAKAVTLALIHVLGDHRAGA